MESKFNRSYGECWDESQIRKKLEERIQELKSPEQKSKSRIKLLRAKISKLNKALEGKGVAGGQILAKENKKIKKKVQKNKKRKRIKKICFKCRKRGHLLKDCRENEDESICFKCGSKEHTLKDCKEENKEELPFASCFVCNKTGHIASQCQENPKGMFPKGSGCHFCGSVRHKKADCPEYKGKRSKREMGEKEEEK